MNTAPASTFSSAQPRAPRFANKALWLIGLGLLANAGVLLYSHATGHAADLVLANPAYGQAIPNAGPQMLGARGLYMMPAQLGPQTFGLYLMDLDSQTITVYKALPELSRFHLMAARSFKYDRFLTDYNTDKPTPSEVQDLVEKQRARQNIAQKTDVPTVNQNPKPDENAPDTAPAH